MESNKKINETIQMNIITFFQDKRKYVFL